LFGNRALPLVTFALFAYNQERYIEEALAGALAQTYRPLEVIFSDDCSTDRTFEIMNIRAALANQSICLKLNRNDENLGLASHINRVMCMANGELIVAAAGDDVSIPTRVAEIVEFYVANEKPDSIFSDYTEIDTSGNALPLQSEAAPCEQTILDFVESPMVKGAAHAWTARLFQIFGPLHDSVMCEDQVLPFRAYFLNRPRYLNKKLVKYRKHDVTIAPQEYYARHYGRQWSSQRQYLADLRLQGLENAKLSLDLRAREKVVCAKAQFWSSVAWWEPKAWIPMFRHSGAAMTAVELAKRLRA